MAYYANIKLFDNEAPDTETKVFEVKNMKAEKAIAKAIDFIKYKDGGRGINKVIDFLIEDFKELEQKWGGGWIR